VRWLRLLGTLKGKGGIALILGVLGAFLAMRAKVAAARREAEAAQREQRKLENSLADAREAGHEEDARRLAEASDVAERRVEQATDERRKAEAARKDYGADVAKARTVDDWAAALRRRGL